MINEQGFLLSYLKYGDFDAIIHFFGLKEGYQSYFVKGAYGKNSRKKALLSPLNELLLTLPDNSSTSKGLQRISQMELLSPALEEEDYKASATLFFAADLLGQVLRSESSTEELVNEIREFLKSLGEKRYEVHLILLARILKLQGHYPLYSNEPYLDPSQGIYGDSLVHPLFDKQISEIFKEIGKSSEPYSVSIAPKHRRLFLDSLLVYCHRHLEGFRAPKSLDIVRELF